MNLRGKRVVVIGFGKSGISAVRLLLVKGAAEVIVSESKPRSSLQPSYLSSMEVLGVKFETGGHNPDTFKKADLVVVSPGVDPKVYHEALALGIPVIGELELAYKFLTTEERENLIAITGTNGKTTTTAMISELFKFSGYKVFTGGNYGIPLSEYILSQSKVDKIVLEVSSFQLERIEEFRPKIGLLLNITPDHLDRYSSLEEYAFFKYKLFANQISEDYALLPLGDFFYAQFKDLIKGKVLFFSEKENSKSSAFLKEDRVVLNLGEEVESYSLTSFRLLGWHNKLNLAVSLLAGRLMGATPLACERLIREFTGFPHRLEWVGIYNYVIFINDSKATNVDATLQALRGLEGPIILILGGQHKGWTYKPLIPEIKHKVKALILMGAAKEIIYQDLKGATEIFMVEDLSQAVDLSFQLAKPYEIVLFSPACSSYDQFRDYQERGEFFKELVKKYSLLYNQGEAKKGEFYH